MKQLHEISNTQEIDRQRVVLLKRLYRQEKNVRHDVEQIQKKWDYWLDLGRSFGSTTTSFTSKINRIISVWKIIKGLFKKG
ncbi:MAG: hypothetical protein IKN91_06585 [Paludibacteraceae bacterium]|nr:hypothetical protein [Paludibacteraceae bacterium]